MDVTEFKRYPKYLKSVHDIAVGEYEDHKKVYEEKLFTEKVDCKLGFRKARFDEELKREIVEFVVEVPKLTTDIKEEGKVLSHCVGSYIDRVIRGETQIIFLRKATGIPLVTLEVRGKVLIQAKGFANRGITKEEQGFIKTYAKEKQLLVRI
jgi:hypothetical protein